MWKIVSGGALGVHWYHIYCITSCHNIYYLRIFHMHGLLSFHCTHYASQYIHRIYCNLEISYNVKLCSFKDISLLQDPVSGKDLVPRRYLKSEQFHVVRVTDVVWSRAGTRLHNAYMQWIHWEARRVHWDESNRCEKYEGNRYRGSLWYSVDLWCPLPMPKHVQDRHQ